MTAQDARLRLTKAQDQLLELLVHYDEAMRQHKLLLNTLELQINAAKARRDKLRRRLAA